MTQINLSFPTTGGFTLSAVGVQGPPGSGGGGGVTDGDKGDITVSGSGATWNIDAGAVGLSKLADIATDSFLGRDTAGTGAPEVLTAAQARGILNVADGATANASDASLRDRATHTGTQAATTITGLAAVATSGSASDLTAGTLPAARFDDTAHGSRAGGALHAGATTSVAGFMSSADKTKLDAITGTNTGDQTITLTGMVTGSGTGSFAASLGSFTKAQLDAAVSDGNVLYVGDVTSNATHTGDATGATALTLATVNSNVGAFGSATQVATFTVNAKGLTTAAGATTIAIPASQITDFNSATRAQTEAELIAGTNVTITPAGSGATRTLTIAASGGGAGTDLTYTAATRVLASSTGTDATLPLVTTGDAGLAPASGGGTTNFLRADGTWAAPSGGGGGGFDYGINAAMSGLSPY